MRVLLLVAVVLALDAPGAAAEELGVSLQSSPAQVATFAVDRPATPLSGPTAITGVSGPEVPAAIDFRPATGELYLYAVKPGSSQTGRLYKVDPISGVATTVGVAQNVVGDFWDIDFDPVSGQLRVMGTDFPGSAAVETHRRLNPDTGAKIADDTQPAFVPGDPSTFKALGGGAYTNSVPGATRTTMFATNSSVLARMGSPDGVPDSPNSGKLFTIGPIDYDSGVSCPCDALDISGATGRAYALVGRMDTTQFMDFSRIALTSGATTHFGRTPIEFPTDMAVAPSSLIGLGSAAASVGEGAGKVTFQVVRRGPGKGAASVTYDLVGQTAAAGSDFTATPGTVSFAAGETTKTIEIPIKADTVDERNETFALRLTSAAGNQREGAVPAGVTSETVTIQDPAPGAREFGMTHRVFAPKPLARGAARKRRRAARGTAFTYRLTENSSVTISVAQRTKGRRVGRRCRKATRRLRHRKRCTRYVRRGVIRVARARSGANETSFSGRFGRRALRPGRYRATLVATDLTGRSSKPLRVGFKVVRR